MESCTLYMTIQINNNGKITRAYFVDDDDLLFGFRLIYNSWQPIPGITPAFGPWEDGAPPTDTGLKYLCEIKRYENITKVYGKVIYDEMECNLFLTDFGDYIMLDDILCHCRSIGAVEGVG